MELEEKPLFTRKDLLDAIQAINERWGQRLCKSVSVEVVKSYEPAFPKKRGFETWSSKDLFCISPQLSLPAWGMEVQVAYLPEKAYDEKEDPNEPIALSTEAIDELLALCHSKVGTLYTDDDFDDYVEKTVDVNASTTRIKAPAVRKHIWEGKQCLDVAAEVAKRRRAAGPPES